MPDYAVTAWLFGKLPTHGDFVSRGLSMAEREHLDFWLASEMQSARGKHGQTFEDRYDDAPPWNFAGIAGEGTWEGGAICPSVDAAGRRFPLLLAQRGLDIRQAKAAANSCMAMIYQTYADGASADDLWRAANALAVPAFDEPAREQWWVCNEQGLVVETVPGRFPSGLIATMLGGIA